MSNDPNAAAKEKLNIQSVRCFVNGLLFPSLEPMAITRPEKPASTIANSVILEVEKASIANYQLAATEKQSRVIVSSLFIRMP